MHLQHSFLLVHFGFWLAKQSNRSIITSGTASFGLFWFLACQTIECTDHDQLAPLAQFLLLAGSFGKTNDKVRIYSYCNCNNKSCKYDSELFSFHLFHIRKGNHWSRKGKHMGTSAGPSVASYVPSRHKLQQNGLQLENAFAGHIGAVWSYACTRTKLCLMSKDNSWVGEGNSQDGQINIGLQGSDPVAIPDNVNMKSKSNQCVQLNQQKKRCKNAKSDSLVIQKTFNSKGKNDMTTLDDFNKKNSTTQPTSQPSRNLPANQVDATCVAIQNNNLTRIL